MTRTTLTLGSGTAVRRVQLESYLTGEQADAAAIASGAWIKRLRHARVDGAPLRRRFTYRDDSLWWFAELYLHKQQVVERLFRTIAALDTVIEREQPPVMSVTDGSGLIRLIAARVAKARGVRFSGEEPRVPSLARLAALDGRGSWLLGAALASRLRRRPAGSPHGASVLAFVHRAFWRAGAADGNAEHYIGQVLQAIEDRLPTGGLQYVSVGPAANFGARRWWHPVIGDSRAGRTRPVEAFASIDSLKPSTQLWRTRHALRRALWQSDDLRAMATIQGCDCWPVIRDELAGIALLQWPWSARAMDEAGAALDALGPSAALTYAEAGGWGRAIVLECRRRGIPTAGLQHGFIYRHWLNYLHEPDEMIADPEHPADLGFPHPSRTLLFDAYAAEHLANNGHFPAHALQVTGSPRLDDLVRTTAALSPDDLARARHGAGARDAEALVVVASKWKEARDVLPGFLRTAAALPGVHVAIKTHPAETPEAYAAATHGLAHVSVLAAAAPLAPLLAASRAVVTVNSTVALDAAVLGVPSLVLGMPNNLSPFVDAGIMAGAEDGDPGATLARLVHDEPFREALAEARRRFLSRYDIRSTGRAAEESALAVLRLAAGTAARKR